MVVDIDFSFTHDYAMLKGGYDVGELYALIEKGL